ncbi:MAG: phage major capsid protein, partial [Acidobacteria bacterium]|nr:phage major capsid protein [Acidobacteriota bacterium]
MKVAGSEIHELTGLVESVAAGMERSDEETKSRFRRMEDWVKEIEDRVSKGLRHAALNPGSGSGDHLREAAGQWFAGAILRRPELISRAEAALGVQKAGLDETNDTEGGYLVPQPLAAEVLRLAAATAAVRPLSRVLPMTSKTL